MGQVKRMMEEQDAWAEINAGECLRCGGDFQIDRDGVLSSLEDYGFEPSVVGPIVVDPAITGGDLVPALQEATGEAEATIVEAITADLGRLCGYCDHMTSKDD